LPLMWQFGPVTIADHRRDDTIAAIARRVSGRTCPGFCARRPVHGPLYRLRDDASAT
jgi:hypothetical protein